MITTTHHLHLYFNEPREREKKRERERERDESRSRHTCQESWFTLDNRRLYCLQRVAVDLLPESRFLKLAPEPRRAGDFDGTFRGCTVDTVAEIRKARVALKLQHHAAKCLSECKRACRLGPQARQYRRLAQNAICKGLQRQAKKFQGSRLRFK